MIHAKCLERGQELNRRLINAGGCHTVAPARLSITYAPRIRGPLPSLRLHLPLAQCSYPAYASVSCVFGPLPLSLRFLRPHGRYVIGRPRVCKGHWVVTAAGAK